MSRKSCWKEWKEMYMYVYTHLHAPASSCVFKEYCWNQSNKSLGYSSLPTLKLVWFLRNLKIVSDLASHKGFTAPFRMILYVSGGHRGSPLHTDLCKLYTASVLFFKQHIWMPKSLLLEDATFSWHGWGGNLLVWDGSLALFCSGAGDHHSFLHKRGRWWDFWW